MESINVFTINLIGLESHIKISEKQVQGLMERDTG